jgi:hypothetical protein
MRSAVARVVEVLTMLAFFALELLGPWYRPAGI